MIKKQWKINWELTDRFQACIERKWEFSDKAPLIERKWIDKSMLSFYIRNYKQVYNESRKHDKIQNNRWKLSKL